MKKLIQGLGILFFFSACHFGHQTAHRAGWTPELMSAAAKDCVKLWARRGLSGDKLVPMCSCVTEGFATSFSTEELSQPAESQKEQATQIALECVKSTGLDLAHLQTSTGKVQ